MSTRCGREPAERAARLAQGASNGRPAILKIVHTITVDGPDGQPWPPPDSSALWVIVRRADGCTLWRAIDLLSPIAATDSQFPMGSIQLKG
jgi:hypothetical protein